MQSPNQQPLNDPNQPNIQLPYVTPDAKKLKNCKKCNNLIDKNLKVCPFCGAKNSSTGKGCAIALVAVLAFIIIVPIAVSGGDETTATSNNSIAVQSVPTESAIGSSTEENSSANDTSSQGLTQSEVEALESVRQEERDRVSRVENNMYLVGETLTTDRIKLTFTKVEDYDPNNELLNPDEGNKIIRVYFVAENVGNTDLFISSYSFDCYADNSTIKKSWSGSEKLFPTSTLSSGRKAEGYIYYEVPEDAEHIEIEYETSYWTQKKATFIVK